MALTAAAAPSIDADIAAFIAEGHRPDETPDAAAPTEEVAPDEVENDEGTEAVEADSDGADPVADSGDAENQPAPSAVDQTALAAAIAAGDPKAFIEALGPAAEQLLSAPAHRALRLAVKEAGKVQAAAKADQQKAEELTTRLGEKYGDPITARKAAENGDPNTFLDMIERWSGGHSWNDIVKWASTCIAGRPARLEAKQRTESVDTAQAAAAKEQKQAEVRAWVDGGLKKLAPELHDPEVVDLVVAEIRAGYAKGITTPAKALPLVRKKLEARYQRLHKVFGKDALKKAAKGKSPSAAAAHTDGGGKTRPTTLEEDIAWAKKFA